MKADNYNLRTKQTGSGWFRLLTMLGLLCATFIVNAQERTVSGTVSDGETNETLPGVTVLVKGTSRGTITDMDGSYKISVADGEVLTFSFVGYENKDITVGNESVVNVGLRLSISELQEIVVVGYGTQEKGDLTGSVASISSKDFNQGPVVSPLQQISGKAAGVNINQVGSEPGQAPSIRVRGITSLIGGNDPLVVVDGIQGNLALLNQIPPSEIKSVEILKDASATAIYGSRGAAGVILITTKSGQAGQTQIEYSAVLSREIIANEYDMLTADEWRTAAAQRGVAESADYGGNTDWFDAITRVGSTQTHNLAFSGGNESFTYRASATAILQEGIINNSNSENYIARFQGTQKLSDKLTSTINLNISSLDRDYNNGGRIAEAITRRPMDPIYTDNPLFTDVGSYFIDPNSFSYINPVARTEEIIDGDLTNNIFTSLRLEYEIFDGLTATAFGSWRKTNREYQSYVSPRTTREDARNLGETESVNDINQLPDGIATVANDVSDEKLYNLILNYKKDFGDHSIDVLGVNEWQKQVYNGGSSTVRGFIVDDPSNIYAMQSADATLYRQGDISSYKNDRTLASFLGRVNYSYMGKYYASASIRRDGSSVFGANNKWANFYAGSLAWRISDEGFMDAVDVIDNLKLRVGYGETGNQQGLGALNSVRLANNDGTTYFGGTVIPNYSITQNENADLRWEVKKMFNAGLDFGFIKGKLTGAIDAFTGVTSDLLFDYEVPQPPYPFGTIKANVGEVLNQGLELSLNYITVDQGDWYVTLGGNVSMNRTEVQELNGSLNGVPLETDYVVWGSGGTTGVASTNNAISHLIIGQPLGSFYLFKHAGVDSNGNQIIDDLDGDGSVEDGNRENDDRYLAGQALPKVTWAFTPTASYKNFDLSVLVRGAHGHQIYNARRATLSALGTLGQSNVLNSALETGVNNITYASDLWLEKGDYVRLENITLGYNFNTTSWSFVESLRLSFTANNLFVITEYTGIDPEISTSGGSGFGIDYGIYPRTRNFAVGLNATF